MFCISHLVILRFNVIDISIDICTVANKNIRNMHAVSTNQVADILHFNDKSIYFKYEFAISV